MLLQKVVNSQKEGMKYITTVAIHYDLSISDVFNYYIEHIHKPREFKGTDFEKGSPNLIVTRSGKIYW